MRGLAIIIFFVFTFSLSFAQEQNDTLYIVYDNVKPNHVLDKSKHKDDPNSKKYYPFDGGKIYFMPKETDGLTKDLVFNFWSYTPSWMDKEFFYKKVHKSILKEKNFKGRQWVEKTEYSSIIECLSEKDKVIMLLDQTQIKGDSAYLVRVYFNFTADE